MFTKDESLKSIEKEAKDVNKWFKLTACKVGNFDDPKLIQKEMLSGDAIISKAITSCEIYLLQINSAHKKKVRKIKETLEKKKASLERLHKFLGEYNPISKEVQKSES